MTFDRNRRRADARRMTRHRPPRSGPAGRRRHVASSPWPWAPPATASRPPRTDGPDGHPPGRGDADRERHVRPPRPRRGWRVQPRPHRDRGRRPALDLADTTATADVDIAGGDARATFALPGIARVCAASCIAVDGTAYVKTTLTGPLYREVPLGWRAPDRSRREPRHGASMLDGLARLPGAARPRAGQGRGRRVRRRRPATRSRSS